MADDNKVEVTLDAKIDDFLAGLAAASAAMDGASSSIRASLASLASPQLDGGVLAGESQALAKELEKDAADEQRIARLRVETEREASRLMLDTRKEQYEEELRAGAISVDQYQALMQKALQDELYAQLAAIDAEHANDLQGSVGHQDALDQRSLANLRYTQQIEQLAEQSAEKQKEIEQKLSSDIQAAFEPIDNYWTTVLDQMLDRSKNSAQEIERAFDRMVISYIEDIAKMLARWLAFQAATAVGWGKIAGAIGNPFSAGASGLGGLFAALFGGGRSSGSLGSGDAIGDLLNMGSLIPGAMGGATSAASTAALSLNTTALTTMTPALTAMAPALTALSPAIATLEAGLATLQATFTALDADILALTVAIEANTAAQGAAGGASGIGDGAGLLSDLIPSFDVGSWHVPHDTLAMVHSGELIAPAGSHAEAARAALSGRGASRMPGGISSMGAGDSHGGHVFNVSPTIHVHPAPGQNLRPEDIAGAISGEMRRFSKFLRP